MELAQEISPHADVVHFLPLGGLGQIGMNCFVLEQAGHIMMVDCGASFPDDDVGEDLLVPDLRWLEERSDRLVGVFITHGHEDHIGAIPHLLRRVRATLPIYAPAHAAALIASRLQEQGIHNHELRVVEPGLCYDVGPFAVEPIRVAHSIVEATALCIQTSAGLILHTADFDLDESQPSGWRTDERRLRELGDAGVRLLLSDSTNIVSERRNGDEMTVMHALDDLVQSASGRVVVSMFSSNVHRLVALFSAAGNAQRKVCLLGRSLRRHYEIAKALGYLSHPSHLLIAPEDVGQAEPNRLLVIAGGSQGEATSALKKLSQRAHPHLRLEPGDQVVISARVIPGHERAVYGMLADLERQLISVVTPMDTPGVHVSGHASRQELAQMLDWVRPESFIPVHGTFSHLSRHARLASESGVGDVLLVENGTMVGVANGRRLYEAERVPAGLTRLVEGGAELDGATRRRRFALARHGVIVISMTLSPDERMARAPKIQSLGVAAVDGDEAALRVIEASVVRAVEQLRGQRMRRREDVVAQAVRSVVLEMGGTRPEVVVHIWEGEGV